MIDFACKKFDIKDIICCSLGLNKSEYNILDSIKNNNYTSKELSKKLNLDLTTVQRALKKLFNKKLLIRNQKNLSTGYQYYYSINDKKNIKKIISSIIEDWSNKSLKEIENW